MIEEKWRKDYLEKKINGWRKSDVPSSSNFFEGLNENERWLNRNFHFYRPLLYFVQLSFHATLKTFSFGSKKKFPSSPKKNISSWIDPSMHPFIFLGIICKFSFYLFKDLFPCLLNKKHMIHSSFGYIIIINSFLVCCFQAFFFFRLIQHVEMSNRSLFSFFFRCCYWMYHSNWLFHYL